MKSNDEISSLTDKAGKELLPGIARIIEQARLKTAVFLNAETTLLYWAIGHFINHSLKENNRTEYGSKILATLSQQLSWSHLIELATISDNLRREFYLQMCIQQKWGIRELREQNSKMLFERTVISRQPEAVITSQLQELKSKTNSIPTLSLKTFIYWIF